MLMSRRRHRRVKLRSMYNWHRYVGVTAALFVMVLAVSGLMLNHTGRLGLDARFVQADWLLDWYGIGAPEHVVAWAAGKHWVSQWDGQLFLDTRALGSDAQALRGALDLGDMLVLATDSRLLLLTPAGERIEVLDSAHGVPANIAALGLSDAGRVVVRAGGELYVGDAQLGTLRGPVSLPAPRWSRSGTLPSAMHETLLARYRGNGLSLERVMLDVHSGRILGAWGVYVMDGAALLMLFLAGSGIWLWIMRWTRERERRRQERGEVRGTRKI